MSLCYGDKNIFSCVSKIVLCIGSNITYSKATTFSESAAISEKNLKLSLYLPASSKTYIITNYQITDLTNCQDRL